MATLRGVRQAPADPAEAVKPVPSAPRVESDREVPSAPPEAPARTPAPTPAEAGEANGPILVA